MLQYNKYVDGGRPYDFGQFSGTDGLSGYYVAIFTLYAVLVGKAHHDLNLKARRQNLSLVPQAEDRIFQLIKMQPPTEENPGAQKY